MIEPNHLLSAAHAAAGSGFYLATRIVGDMRSEFDQLTSLLEAVLGEAEAATDLDGPERRRAFNLARCLHDMLRANALALSVIETNLMMVSRVPLE